jgi:Type II CAAX prenyl endopeptidase Rce1-like
MSNYLKSIFKKSIFLKYIIPLYFVGNICFGIFLRMNSTSNSNIFENDILFFNIIIIISGTLVAPIYEEFMYRFWLKDFSSKYFFIKVFMLAFTLYSLVINTIQHEFKFLSVEYSKFQYFILDKFEFTDIFYIKYDFVRFSIITILLFFSLFGHKLKNIENKFINKKVDKFFSSSFFVFFSAFIFSFSHQQKYDHLIVFIILFFDGLMFGYIRKFLSFKLSIIIHSFSNTIILLLSSVFIQSKNLNNYLIIGICILEFVILNKFYYLESKKIFNKK